MKNKQDRRGFLRAGLAGAAALPLTLSCVEKKEAMEKDGKFVYRTLGKTGIKLPVVSMGVGDTNNPNLIRSALDEGVVLLATSNYYGNGRNEEVVGSVLKERKRNSYVIMTSAVPNATDHKNGLFTKATKAEPFLRQLESSLKNLNVEQIDIFLLPFTAKRESVFFEPLLRAMEDIKKQGKAKYIGIATHKFEQEAIRAAIDAKIYDVVMTAYNFKRKNIEEIQSAVADANKAGLGVIAMKTMAGAYWDKEKTQPINSKAALKFVLQDKNVHTAVPGITTYDQLVQDIAIMEDIAMTKEEKDDLQLGARMNLEGLYCQQCGTCVSQCKQALDIPTMMRSYMYAYGYGNMANAQAAISNVSTNHNPCQDCGDCTVKCEMGFNVKERVTDIARINDIPQEFFV